ncbi:MAG: class I SAM-dependent methyltransferase [Gammaproteobacteria bacterium]|nr:class I SAM-dependent methyltransferase [Gammaproteobacteria bacterium]MDH5653774.1 class I SAM-dependent methyltransferase [Gammaproteobacteria bacterium]
MNVGNKPYSESSEQNRAPILAVIQPLLQSCHRLLEIGSGTGQHAVYFAPEFPHLIWQPSDRQENLPGIRLWLAETQAANIPAPLELDVTQANNWPQETCDAVFTANTLHIMHWHEVEAFFQGVGRLLEQAGRLMVYGPFNYNGRYTSPSNEQFDAWLKQRDPHSGIRHFEAINELAEAAGLYLIEDYAMPANNRILYWRKHDSALTAQM